MWKNKTQMIVKINWVSIFLSFFLIQIPVPGWAQSADTRPRTIVTTDGEIDDVDSYIRMLLYANEFNLEGLIYSSSQWHYKGDGNGTPFTSELEMTKNIYGERTELRWPGTSWMDTLIDAYAQVYPMLIQNAKGYPTADHLRHLVHVGNIDFEGEMAKETDGSNFIMSKLLEDDPRPIYLQAWGGTNTIARALKSIQEKFSNTPDWDAIYRKVSGKTILYMILDQDATYKKYIQPNWPDIKVYYNTNQFWSFAYFWKRTVPEEMQHYLEGSFMGPEIIHGHGPLLALYYSYGDGQKQAGDPEHIHGDPARLEQGQWGSFDQYDFISEGDSPAYLHLIDVGLDNLQHPDYGGWGGRLVASPAHPLRWEDGDEVADWNPFTRQEDKAYPQTRWIPAIQEDFAARADWCVMPYEQANHAPLVKLKGKSFRQAHPGDKISIKVKVKDPDGDAATIKFWQYKEAGTYPGEILLTNHGRKATLVLPDAPVQTGTIHVIAEVKDLANRPMTRYARLVIQVQ